MKITDPAASIQSDKKALCTNDKSRVKSTMSVKDWHKTICIDSQLLIKHELSATCPEYLYSIIMLLFIDFDKALR